MREIKFRVWAHASQVMFLPDSDEGWGIVEGCIYEIPNTTLMQYTGLKDKNGVEIYEGDIVKSRMTDRPYSSKAKGFDVLCEVVWKDGGPIGPDKTLISDDPGFYPKVVVADKRARCYSWSLFNRCEVIGNIYEDQELLEEK